MENPFLRINKLNTFLKIGISALALALVLSLVFAQNTVKESIKEVYIYKKIFVKEFRR